MVDAADSKSRPNFEQKRALANTGLAFFMPILPRRTAFSELKFLSPYFPVKVTSCKLLPLLRSMLQPLVLTEKKVRKSPRKYTIQLDFHDGL